MRKSEIKLMFLEIISILFFVFNILIKNILNQYTTILFLGLIFIVSISISTFEKEKVLDRKSVTKTVIIYTLSFLVFIYSLGIFFGYVKTSYSLKIINIIKNIFPVIFLIVIEELFRYHISTKGEKKKIILVLSVLLFVLVDVSLVTHLYSFTNHSKIVELITMIIFPSIFKNSMLLFLSHRYGYRVCIIYQLIANIYLYIMPIFTDLSKYLQSVLMVLLPLFVGLSVYFGFKKMKMKDFKNKTVALKLMTGIIISITIIMIALYSNLFSYTVAVIATGSMNPTLKRGDMIIIDKGYRNKLDKLEVGEILVFRVKDVIYTHRIVKIVKKNGRYSILTKGDRKGQAIDSWTVTDDDIFGIVKLKIPKIGYPSVWLNRLVEG